MSFSINYLEKIISLNSKYGANQGSKKNYNIDILIRTVILASVVSIGAAIIGFPIAYYMAKFTTPKIKIFFYLAIMLPF